MPSQKYDLRECTSIIDVLCMEFVVMNWPGVRVTDEPPGVL